MFLYDRELRRVYIFNCRVHHGAVGAALLAVGLALVLDDWHDRGVWFRIERLISQGVL